MRLGTPAGQPSPGTPAEMPNPPRPSYRGNRPGNTRPRRQGAPVRSGQPPTEAPPRPRLTSRAAIVVLVVAVLVVSYASSMRAYLTQHSDIASLKSQIAKSRYDIGQLQRERNRWHDKAFVEEQARQRFGWVLPGEVSYQVIGRNGKPLTQGNQLANSSTVARQIPTPWWAKAYGTLTAVDHPRQASVPVGSIKPPAGTKKK